MSWMCSRLRWRKAPTSSVTASPPPTFTSGRTSVLVCNSACSRSARPSSATSPASRSVRRSGGPRKSTTISPRLPQGRRSDVPHLHDRPFDADGRRTGGAVAAGRGRTARRYPNGPALAHQSPVQRRRVAGCVGAVRHLLSPSAGARRVAPPGEGGAAVAECRLAQRRLPQLCRLCDDRTVPRWPRRVARPRARALLRDHVRRSSVVALPPPHRLRLPAGGRRGGRPHHGPGKARSRPAQPRRATAAERYDPLRRRSHGTAALKAPSGSLRSPPPPRCEGGSNAAAIVLTLGEGDHAKHGGGGTEAPRIAILLQPAGGFVACIEGRASTCLYQAASFGWRSRQPSLGKRKSR